MSMRPTNARWPPAVKTTVPRAKRCSATATSRSLSVWRSFAASTANCSSSSAKNKHIRKNPAKRSILAGFFMPFYAGWMTNASNFPHGFAVIVICHAAPSDFSLRCLHYIIFFRIEQSKMSGELEVGERSATRSRLSLWERCPSSQTGAERVLMKKNKRNHTLSVKKRFLRTGF